MSTEQIVDIEQDYRVPEGWREVKLGEVCDVIGGGTPKTKVPEYWDGNIPWLTPRDLSGFSQRYISRGERSISEAGLLESSAKLVPKGTVLLTTRAPIGYLAIAENQISTNQGFRSLVPSQEIDTLFLFYLLKNNIDYLKSQSDGTTFGELAGSTLKSLFFLIPPLPEQKAIAEALGSLDDKIDILHRQNQTLENLAQTLFYQYFIKKSDPSWETVALGNSNLCKVLSSGIMRFMGEKSYLATKDVKGGNIENMDTNITYDDRPARANMQPVEYSVWFAKKGGVRKVLMFDSYSKEYEDTIILSTGFAGLKTTHESHYYIWCLIMGEDFQELKDSHLSGSVQPDINNEGIAQLTLLKPNKEMLFDFNSKTKLIFAKVYSNKRQIYILEKIRDILLLKLLGKNVKTS